MRKSCSRPSYLTYLLYFNKQLNNFVCRHLRLWYTDTEYVKAIWVNRLLSYAIPAISTIQILSTLIYLILHPLEQELGIILQKTAHTLSSSLGIFLMYFSISRRDALSHLLRVANEMAHNSRAKRLYLKYRRRQNIIYLGNALILLMSLIPLFLMPVFLVLVTFRSGELHFRKILSIDGGPFSAINYVQAFLDYLTYLHIYWFSLLYLSIVWGIYLQISVSYQVLADDLRELRSKRPIIDEKLELEQFKLHMKEYQKLKEWVLIKNILIETNRLTKIAIFQVR